MGRPVSFAPLGAELRKKDPRLAELIEQPCTVTRGLRKPRKEEITGAFSLPGIPEEGEFTEAWDVIGDMQRPSSAEAPSFAKKAEVAKTSDSPLKKGVPNPSTKPVEPAKDSRKRGRSLLTIKSASSKVLGQKSPELLKSGQALSSQADPKDASGSRVEQPLSKKLKPSEARPPPGKSLTFQSTRVEPLSFAYPSDLPDPSREDQLTIAEIRQGARSTVPTIIDLSVRMPSYSNFILCSDSY